MMASPFSGPTRAAGTRKPVGRAPAGEDAGQYKVGYGKPPIASRFKKGMSGNPRGRPPGRQPRVADELTDEQILQMVKERKLTWLALFDLYLDEKLAEETRDRADGRRPAQGE